MAFTPGDSHGVTAGATPVTVVAAPVAATQRELKTLTVYNADTAIRTLTFRKNLGGGVTRNVCVVDLDVGDNFVWNDVIGLSDVAHSLEILLDGAVTTNELPFTSTFADLT